MNVGQWGEDLVEQEYRKRGYEIIGRNVRLHASKQIGELDIVAVRLQEIVFVEVKTRSSQAFGSPVEAIGHLKRRRLVNAAQVFLLRHPQYDAWDWRIDVAAVAIDKQAASVIIIPNAIDGY